MNAARFRLIPHLATAPLGAHHYIYDAGAIERRVVVVPTQRISRQAFETLGELRAKADHGGVLSGEVIASLCASQPERVAFVDLLNRAGYLEELPPSWQGPPGIGETLEAEVRDFREAGVGHYLQRPSLFHVPADLQDADADVGVVGVPVASRPISEGAALGPAYLRQASCRTALWFDAYRRGFYSDIGCEGGLPRSLCRGVVLKDCGDIGGGAETVGELFGEIKQFVTGTLLDQGLPVLFVGGDHAISFPILDALLEPYPDLCLIHFDAHHDAFYDARVAFDHAVPIRALLLHSGLKDVYSFGLRTVLDGRAPGFETLTRSEDFAGRLHLFSLGETRRLIASPERFRALLQSIPAGRPCYVSIDLDVLSADAVRGRVSTPAGAGLEWHELLDAVRLIFDERRVVAADLVELNPANGNGPGDPPELLALVVMLADRLARRRA